MSIYKLLKKDAGPGHIVDTIGNLLKTCGIPATTSHIRNVLLSHPDYPSLLALSEVLKEWKVKSEAVQGTVGDLSEVDSPGIAYLKNNQYVILDSIDEGHVTIIFPGRKKFTISKDFFSNIWTGVILRVFPEKNARETDYRLNRKRQLLSRLQWFIGYPGFFAFAVSILAYSAIGHAGSIRLLLLGMVKLTGILVCLMMIGGGIGDSGIFDRFCPNRRIVNCRQVMKSPAGKLMGIPMPETGLLYFAGGFLALFFSILAGQWVGSLFALGLFCLPTLPYTIFSIVYQAFVVRSWCWLCLVVQALFWLEFALLHPYVFSKKQTPGMDFLFPVAVGYLGVLFTWFALRPFFKRYFKLKGKDDEVSRLRRNPDFIHSQLSRVKKIDTGIFPFEVIIGPQDAPITLILLLNPLCKHCGATLKEMDRLIDFGNGLIKGILRFWTDAGDEKVAKPEKSLDRQVAQIILTLAEKGKKEDVRNALLSWFSQDYNDSHSFFENWRRNDYTFDDKSLEKAEEVLIIHDKWTRTCGLNGTPTLFLNQQMLPPAITFKDLKYFILRFMGN